MGRWGEAEMGHLNPGVVASGFISKSRLPSLLTDFSVKIYTPFLIDFFSSHF
jgi:hypothetical protein